MDPEIQKPSELFIKRSIVVCMDGPKGRPADLNVPFPHELKNVLIILLDVLTSAMTHGAVISNACL